MHNPQTPNVMEEDALAKLTPTCMLARMSHIEWMIGTERETRRRTGRKIKRTTSAGVALIVPQGCSQDSQIKDMKRQECTKAGIAPYMLLAKS